MPDSIVACQAPLSMGFPRQEYWSGLPFPSPGDLPNPGIKPISPAWQVGSLPQSHLGSLEVAHKLEGLGPHDQEGGPFLGISLRVEMLQEGGPLPGPETGLLSNTWK